MFRIGRIAKWVVLTILSARVSISPICRAEDGKMTPETLVARHLQSIAAADVLANTKSRAFQGSTKALFQQGAFGELSGMAQFASDGHKLAIILSYGGQDYRGEHFAFDGKSVTVGRYLPGKISTLAEFINRFDGLMKEGLLGGVLSTSWPLYDSAAVKSRLKYSKAKIAGQAMHTLEFRGKGLGDFKIVLYFDPETFRHLKTEYKLHISAGRGSGPATGIGIETADTYYLLTEEFANFKKVDDMTLPQLYTIKFSSEGQTRTFVGRWIVEAEQWNHNALLDENLFKAAVY
jgi:hypothetical protein